MDRRTKSRIDVQLTCFVGAGKAQASPLPAFTENVSRNGMLMRWIPGTPLPNLDKTLILDVKLPENSEIGPRVMRCRTEVVRITPAGDTHAVALRILSMRFVKSKKSTGRSDLASERSDLASERSDLAFERSDLASMPVTADRVN